MKKSNILTIIVLVFITARQVPILLKNMDLDGQEIKAEQYELINEKEEFISFPSQDKRTMAIFWASWCGPCKVEMNRLLASVNKGSINKDQIFAINPYENKEVITRFLKENPYPFSFIQAPEVASQLNIELTPTTVLMDKTKIESISSGISVIGIWRAEFFLKSTRQ